MALRIYAFAKDLGLDNKDLLDICEKVGIKGKGSALASLDDDEIIRIKKFMAGGEAANGTAAPAAKKSTLAPAPTPTTEMRREDLQPVRAAPVRDLDDLNKKKPPEEKPDAPRREPAKKRPGLNVAIAAMPEVKQPPLGRHTETVKVQKPDIALPQEALLKARKGGSVAPLEEFTNKNKTKTPKVSPRKTTKTAVAPLGDLLLRDAAARGKGRRDRASTGEGFDSDLGSTRQHRAKRKDKGDEPSVRVDGDDDSFSRRRSVRRRGGSSSVNTAAPRKEKITLQLPCTVRSFSEAAGVSAVQVLLSLPGLGEAGPKNINSDLSADLVELLSTISS